MSSDGLMLPDAAAQLLKQSGKGALFDGLCRKVSSCQTVLNMLLTAVNRFLLVPPKPMAAAEISQSSLTPSHPALVKREGPTQVLVTWLSGPGPCDQIPILVRNL